MEQVIPNPDKINLPFVPSVEAIQTHLHNIEHARQDAEDLAAKIQWQQRVQTLERELYDLRTRASSGDYRIGEIRAMPETRSSPNAHRSSYEYNARMSCIDALGKLGLSEGDTCQLHSEAEYTRYIGMGESSIYRKVTELLTRLPEGWLYIFDEQPAASEAMTQRDRDFPNPGVKKYFLSPALDQPVVEKDTALHSPDMNLAALTPRRWSEVSPAISKFVKGVRTERLRKRIVDILDDSPVQPDEKHPKIFTKSVVLSSEDESVSTTITARFWRKTYEPGDNPMVPGESILGSATIVHQAGNGESLTFEIWNDISSKDNVNPIDTLELLLK